MEMLILGSFIFDFLHGFLINNGTCAKLITVTLCLIFYVIFVESKSRLCGFYTLVRAIGQGTRCFSVFCVVHIE